MWEDPIFEEVRRVREAHAAQYNNDLLLIYQALKAQEDAYQGLKVSLPPKPVVVIKPQVVVTK